MLYSVLLFFIFPASLYGEYIYAMGSFAIAYVFFLNAFYTDIKNNADLILNSLPVTRREIVRARYLSAFVFTAIGLLIVGVAGLLLKISPLPLFIDYLGWTGIITSFLCSTVYISICMPLSYKIKMEGIQRIFNVLIFMLIFFIPNLLGKMAKNNELLFIQPLLDYNTLHPWALPLLGVTVIAAMLIISYNFTLRIYHNMHF
jgi:hypothetical protein